MRSYNEYLLESFKNSFLLILEGYIYGSSNLVSKLEEIKRLSVDISVTKIVRHLLEIFKEDELFDDAKINQNYFDLVDNADDKVSFIQSNRLKDYDYELDSSEPKEVYTMPGRSEIKIGRIVKQLLLLKGVSVTGKEVEDFVNTFKSTKNDGLEFKLVSGDDIQKYYDEVNYFNKNGALGNSCMSDASRRMLKIYTENPKKVKLLVLFDSNDKVHGRALVWKLKKSPCDSLYFMDKIYTNKDSHDIRFKTFANQNDWMIRLNSFAGLGDNWKFKYKDKEYFGEITVKLDGNFRKYPYLDTLCFLSKDKDGLSNLPDKKCWWLHDTEGGKDRCEHCEGNIWSEGDKDNEKLCYYCCDGHVGLSEMGIETKWNKKI
jgi:hypothetical protein